MKPHLHILTSNFNPSPPPHLLLRRRPLPSSRLPTASLSDHNARRRPSSEYSLALRAVVFTPLLAAVGFASCPTKVEEEEAVISARIYDATEIEEPLALGKDKKKVWEKLMNARIVYLGEAEQVPITDDKELEL
ncbi:hypothetical protein F3Y22_tig00112289pilonHSYRG00181 [Hibiscus syriacus]|uniref:Uncharacterized protein n=1 Tax=Hibiscus syriacus TaxID=106335 RepID=A0A6A2Y0K5_HIBSY|nr:hypothetical protein F3Y22_tig00112289pilonHSYRG00181 [Hibiscus syriacus]